MNLQRFIPSDPGRERPFHKFLSYCFKGGEGYSQEVGVKLALRVWPVIVLVASLYGIYDIYCGNLLAGSSELIYSALITINVALLSKRKPELMIDLNILVTILFFWVLLITGGEDLAGIVYLPILPAVIFFFTTRCKGVLWLSIFLIGISSIIIGESLGVINTVYNEVILTNLLVVLFILSIISVVNAYIRSAQEKMLIDQKEKLQKLLLEVEELKERYRLIFENAPVGILSFDHSGKILEVNSAATKILKMPRDQLINLNLSELLEADPLSSDHLIIENQRGDGENVVLRVLISKVLSGDKLVGGICIIEDITEKVLREQRERTLLRKLNRLERLEDLSLSLGELAHDLKNVLAPAAMLSQDLLIRLKDEGREDLLHPIGVIYRSVSRTLEILEDILLSVKLDGKRITLCDLRKLLSELLSGPEFEELKRAYPNVKVRAHVPEEPMLISANKWDIYKALLNLVKNAFEAIDGEGEVQLRLYRERVEKDSLDSFEPIPPGDYVVLEVSDTGVGIPEDKLIEIFKPYISYKRSGTGLGLFIVYSTVKAYGGYIDVKSVPNKGSTFRLLFREAKNTSQNLDLETEGNLPEKS